MSCYVIPLQVFIPCSQLKRWKRRRETDNVTETGDETVDKTDNGDEHGLKNDETGDEKG
jgi:hypothetical protein